MINLIQAPKIKPTIIADFKGFCFRNFPVNKRVLLTLSAIALIIGNSNIMQGMIFSL